jgi:hypothetical protein
MSHIVDITKKKKKNARRWAFQYRGKCRV